MTRAEYCNRYKEMAEWLFYSHPLFIAILYGNRVVDQARCKLVHHAPVRPYSWSCVRWGCGCSEWRCFAIGASVRCFSTWGSVYQ